LSRGGSNHLFLLLQKSAVSLQEFMFFIFAIALALVFALVLALVTCQTFPEMANLTPKKAPLP
jgi:hypothetical protein